MVGCATACAACAFPPCCLLCPAAGPGMRRFVVPSARHDVAAPALRGVGLRLGRCLNSSDQL